ncbi:hypothetical protein LJB93_00005 [Desulfovibrio sp. OttesenSCG-928-F07]|nr:hypothetical protein [Desulfovibrio sp. OttesenSCG-928-F07]
MADTALSKTEAKNPFTVIILAGISGAGKTTVINVFEDMQFFTIDGMPFEIVPRMQV